MLFGEKRCTHEVIQFIAKRRSAGGERSFSGAKGLFVQAGRYVRRQMDIKAHYNPFNRIFAIDFTFNFNSSQTLTAFCTLDLEDATSSAWFLFFLGQRKIHLQHLRTMLSECILLWRFTAPCPGVDAVEVFGKHGLQLLNILFEITGHLLESRL